MILFEWSSCIHHLIYRFLLCQAPGSKTGTAACAETSWRKPSASTRATKSSSTAACCRRSVPAVPWTRGTDPTAPVTTMSPRNGGPCSITTLPVFLGTRPGGRTTTSSTSRCSRLATVLVSRLLSCWALSLTQPTYVFLTLSLTTFHDKKMVISITHLSLCHTNNE